MSKDTTSGKTARSRTTRRPDTVKIKIKGRWTAIPNKLLKDRRLSRDARLLGCLIFMHAGNAGRAFPSQEELAEELGQTITQDDGTTQERNVTVRSIQRWLKELKAVGWVEWRKTLLNNEYTLFDPDETPGVSTPTEGDSSLHNGLTDQPEHEFDTTQESCSDTTQGSGSNATERSPRATQGSSEATQESCSNTTHGSPGATQESYGATQESCPTYIVDSLLIDSSSSESAQRVAADVGVNGSQTDSFSDTSNHDISSAHTNSSLYLAERGINAALEFRDMPLPLIEEVWHRLIGRNPDTDLSVVVRALRAVRARQAQEAPAAPHRTPDPATYAERQAAAARRARQIAPSDATDEEIEWLVLDMAEGGMAEEAACTRLEERRAFRDYWADRE